MVWFFDRQGQRLRYEIRHASDGGYELEVTFPDGRAEREQLRDAAELLERCAALAERLKSEGWLAG
jgi:hypothetical protein